MQPFGHAFGLFFFVAAAATVSQNSQALELDWSGQFRAEMNYLHNYTLDGSDGGANVDPTRPAPGSPNAGYYIPGGGSTSASFETLFLRVRPKLVVNDNIYIKSEWWLGDPVYGFFGGGAPYSGDQRLYNSTMSRGATITAQRYWAEILTDIGTVQIGRAPLNWGLGIVWNSGDGLWDRYESTGDQIRLLSKFGSFSVSPAFILYSTGNNLGGAYNFGSSSGPVPGSGGVADYSIALKYENPDEDFEGGVNFIRRVGGAAQDNFGFGASTSAGNAFGAPSVSPQGFTYNTWDIYTKKKIGKFTVSAEVPIISGTIGSTDYSTYAVAAEANFHINDSWETQLNVGHVPGQPNSSSGALSNYKAFYMHPNYKLGMVMFNYNLASFAGPNTLNNPTGGSASLRSPYDNPITDANYLGLTGAFHTDKWNFHGSFVYAKALETATSGNFFWNTREKRYVLNSSGKDQSSSLGWEMDYGTTFQWDETFQFGLDFGFYFPGQFHAFSNAATDNPTDMLFTIGSRVGINF